MTSPLRNARPVGRRPRLALLGALLLLGGLAGGMVLAVAVYGDSPAAQHRALQLGLAGCLLASAVAQVMILVGGWALWSGLRRRA